MSPFLVRWIKLSLVVVVGCGFLAMAIYAFVMRDEIRNAQIEPPLVTAPEDALKRRPEQPGGMEIPNRDKLVFDLLDSEATVSGAFPVPAPGEAQQVTDTTAVQDGEVEETAVSPDTVKPAQPAAAPAAVAVPAQKVVEAAKAEVKPVSATVAKVEAKPAAPVAAVETKPVAEAAKPAAETAKPKTEGGKWGVQLAAVGSKADGDKMAAKLTKQYSALNGLSPKMQATPDGKRFRVQFFGLKDRNAASSLCSKLGSKQACFPVAPK